MNMEIYFNSYKNIIDVLSEELDFMNKLVDEFNKNPLSIDINLSDRVQNLKKSLDLSNIESEYIDFPTFNDLSNEIKFYQNRLDKLMDDFSKLKDKIAYGGNIFRAILNKPKVYNSEENEESYYKINNNIRQINYMVDWIEKGLLDLSSLVNKDLTVINLVNRIYKRRKIYESECIGKVLSEL